MGSTRYGVRLPVGIFTCDVLRRVSHAFQPDVATVRKGVERGHVERARYRLVG
jgi:hypothetical protein